MTCSSLMLIRYLISCSILGAECDLQSPSLLSLPSMAAVEFPYKLRSHSVHLLRALQALQRRLLCSFFNIAASKLTSGEAVTATFPPLLAAFQHLECLVVAAESLMLRLPGEHQLVNRLLEAAAGQAPSVHEAQTSSSDRGKTSSESMWSLLKYLKDTPKAWHRPQQPLMCALKDSKEDMNASCL